MLDESDVDVEVATADRHHEEQITSRLATSSLEPSQLRSEPGPAPPLTFQETPDKMKRDTRSHCPADIHLPGFLHNHSLCYETAEIQSTILSQVLVTEVQWVRHMRSMRETIQRHCDAQSALRVEYDQLEGEFFKKSTLTLPETQKVVN